MPDPTPEPNATPASDPDKPAEPSAEDKLVSAIKATAEHTATATATAVKAAMEESRAAQPPPADTTIADARNKLLEDCETLMTEGKYKEALEKINESAISPHSQQIQTLALGMARNNRDKMREKFGDKFAKREELFNSQMRKFGLSEEMLADPGTVEKLWNITTSEDPTFVKEEVDEQLAAAKAEADRAAASQTTPSLAPITDAYPLPDHEAELAKEYISDDPEQRSWELAQLAAYGVPLDAFLRQAAKNDDPESSVFVGRGEWRRRICTEMGGKSRPAPKPPVAPAGGK